MTPASPAANSEEAGTGQTWFKIWEALPTFVPSTTSSPGSLDFPYQGECATPELRLRAQLLCQTPTRLRSASRPAFPAGSI